MKTRKSQTVWKLSNTLQKWGQTDALGGPFKVWWPLNLNALFAKFPLHAELCKPYGNFSSCLQRLMGLSAFSSFFLRERNSLGRAGRAPICSPSSLCLLGFCRRHSCTSVTIFPNVGTMSLHQGSIHRSSRFPWGSTSLMTAATPFLRLLTGGAEAATWKSHDWTMCRLFRQNPGRPRH